jgi:hypothetical protein
VLPEDGADHVMRMLDDDWAVAETLVGVPGLVVVLPPELPPPLVVPPLLLLPLVEPLSQDTSANPNVKNTVSIAEKSAIFLVTGFIINLQKITIKNLKYQNNVSIEHIIYSKEN